MSLKAQALTVAAAVWFSRSGVLEMGMVMLPPALDTCTSSAPPSTGALSTTSHAAVAAGVRILPGTRITGLRMPAGKVTAVETNHGLIACDQLVIAAGPWVRDFWAMLQLPDRIDVTDQAGIVHPDQPMWTYWALQEGTLEVDPGTLTTGTGGFPPVVHLDSDAPLYDDIDGSLITDKMWGIYFKLDFSFGGVQGGAAPYRRPACGRDCCRPLWPGQR
jgi:hypothetical protein